MQRNDDDFTRWQVVCLDEKGQEFLDADLFRSKKEARDNVQKFKNFKIIGWVKIEPQYKKYDLDD